MQARDVCGELTDADIIAEVTNEKQKNWDEEEDSNSVNIQPVPKSTRNGRLFCTDFWDVQWILRKMCFSPLRMLLSEMY